MGCYINPPTEEKESFLNKHGTRVGENPVWPAPEGEMYVVLVDNGPFTAAAVAYSEEEFNVFSAPDPRPTIWYSVPVDKIKAASNWETYKEYF